MQFLRYIFTLVICVLLKSAFAQVEQKNTAVNGLRNKYSKTNFSFSSIIGFYRTNIHHSVKPSAKKGFNVSVKKDFSINNTGKDFLTVGIEYLYHGVNFISYYFYKDSLKLYEPNNLRFQYDLIIHELDFPIQFKYSFLKETSYKYSGYIFGGYCYRWLLKGNLQVTDNEYQLENQSLRLVFKNYVLIPENNSFLTVGGGFQKNILAKNKSIFLEAQYRYDLSSFYFEKSFAPNSLFINNRMLFLTVGFKI